MKETEKRWTVKAPWGYWFQTHMMKRDAVAELFKTWFCEDSPLSYRQKWRQLKKYGLQVVKVTVTIEEGW